MPSSRASMNSTLSSQLLALAAGLSLTAACGGGAPQQAGQHAEEPSYVSGAEAKEKRLSEAEERHNRLMETGRARGATAADPDARVEGLAFATIALTPEVPKASTESLRATTTLEPGATAFTEVEYSWFVGGRELVGQNLAVLRKGVGKWKTGDTIEVVANAIDEKGRTAQSERISVTIDNTPPVITTDLRKIRYLSGTKLKAHDEDGDEVIWSVKGEPPGVSISPTGVINVRNVQLKEAFSGEAVFVATDPYGAASEIHIPLSINAAVASKTEEAGQKTALTIEEQMTDEELIKAAEADVDNFEKMSDEDVNKELDRRDAVALPPNQR